MHGRETWRKIPPTVTNNVTSYLKNSTTTSITDGINANLRGQRCWKINPTLYQAIVLTDAYVLLKFSSSNEYLHIDFLSANKRSVCSNSLEVYIFLIYIFLRFLLIFSELTWSATTVSWVETNPPSLLRCLDSQRTIERAFSKSWLLPSFTKLSKTYDVISTFSAGPLPAQ